MTNRIWTLLLISCFVVACDIAQVEGDNPGECVDGSDSCQCSAANRWIQDLLKPSSIITLCSSFVALTLSLLALVYARQKSRHDMYSNSMGILLQMKQGIVDTEYLVEKEFTGQLHFDRASRGLYPQHFMAICILWYRIETLWRLSIRQGRRYKDPEWHTVWSLVIQYLTVDAVREVFKQHISIHESHEEGFRDSFSNLIENIEEGKDGDVKGDKSSPRDTYGDIEIEPTEESTKDEVQSGFNPDDYIVRILKDIRENIINSYHWSLQPIARCTIREYRTERRIRYRKWRKWCIRLQRKMCS